MRSCRPFLFGMTGLDTFDVNAEPEPSHREFTEAEESIAVGERHAIVGTDR